MIAIIDRLLAAVAGRLAGRRVSAWLAGIAEVRITRLPFLPQLWSGRYGQIDIAVATLSAGGIELRDFHGQLTAVRAPLRTLLTGTGITANGVSASASIPLSVIAARLPAGLELRWQGDELAVSGIALLMPVFGTLALRPEGQRIVVVPKVLGVPSLVAFAIPLNGLPPGLTIECLRPGDSTVELIIGGQNIRIGT